LKSAWHYSFGFQSTINNQKSTLLPVCEEVIDR